MAKSLQALILLALVSFSPLRAEDYVITINGAVKEIGLDKETALTLPDGTSLRITLHRKEILRFTSELFSFEHRSEYQPSRSDLGDGIFQTMLVTPLGTGILVQEYMEMDPTTLVDLMLQEITKEEVEYGYKYSEKAISRTVHGIALNGKQAVTTYPGEEWTRSVLAYGGKDKGVIVVTFIEKDNYGKEMNIIEHLWKSLDLRAIPK